MLILNFLTVEVQSDGLSSDYIFVGGGSNSHYDTIKEAYDNAKEGDTIYVKPGVYYVNLVIDKPIYLIGENKYTTILDGLYNGYVFFIASDNVFIKDFTIQNTARETGNSVIVLSNSDDSIIMDNIIYSHTEKLVYDNGITMFRSDNNLIFNNIFKNVKNFIRMIFSNSNTIKNNEFHGLPKLNAYYGIKMIFSKSNEIKYNEFIDNDICMTMLLSKNNEILYNSFEQSGIALFLLFSSKTAVTNNDFIDNFFNIININSEKITLRGNYWERRRFLPKLCFRFMILSNGEKGFDIDWRPAKEPNVI